MAAGGHNALVFGTPGAGKTMLARRISGIMADLAPEDAVTATRLYSLAGALVPGQDADMSVERGALITRPPFRSPHHSASSVGILGGGKTVKPGEISLAHGGVLFLDEAPQFHRDVLQSLRGPLEDRRVTISRAEGQVKLPASFQLLLAANPCPCGRLGLSDQNNTKAECYCSDNEIKRYWRRFGEALLDRVELRVPVHAPSIDALAARENTEESSAKIRARVEKAVSIQRERFYLDGNGTRNNAGMSVSEIEKHCVLDEKAESAMRKAVEKLGLSGRAYHGVLRVARTVADLDGNESISGEALLEAVAHRRDGDDPYVFNQQPRHGCYT
jgi:magnesium chelatase family protein